LSPLTHIKERFTNTRVVQIYIFSKREVLRIGGPLFASPVTLYIPLQLYDYLAGTHRKNLK